MKKLAWIKREDGVQLSGTAVNILFRKGYLGDIYQLMFEGRNYGAYWELDMAMIDGARLGGDTLQAYERAAAIAEATSPA